MAEPQSDLSLPIGGRSIGSAANAAGKAAGPKPGGGWGGGSAGDSVFVAGVGPSRVLAHSGSEVLVADAAGGERSVRRRDMYSPTTGSRLEYLQPAADCETRRVSSGSAVFSLLSTMMGGGVLSLPYAFRALGLIPALVATVVTATASAFTIDLLISASRATGAVTYAELARRAFGPAGSHAVLGLTFAITWLCTVAYGVLIADLVGPLTEGFTASGESASRDLIVLIAFGAVSPWCFASSLHSLRLVTVLAFLSLITVVGALLYHAGETLGTANHRAFVAVGVHEVPVLVRGGLKLWTEKPEDLPYVGPVFLVSFLCHFNVLPMHNEMRRPTRSRTKGVVNCSVGIVTVLYVLAGICGYAWAGHFTCGNILLNFSAKDLPINIARGALSACLVGGLPLFILPCRSCLHQLLARSSAAGIGAEVHVYERSPTAGQQRVGSYNPEEAAADVEAGFAVRAIETALLLGTTAATTVVLDSVMMIWSIIGSTICVLIGFTFPPAIWLRLKTDGAAWKVRTAQAIFVSSLVFGVLCTVGAVMNLNRPACPAEVLEASSNATPAIARAGSPAAAAVLAGPNASLPVNASLPLNASLNLNASLPFSILA